MNSANEDKKSLLNNLDINKLITINQNLDLVIETLYFIKLDDYTELIKHIIICVNNILETKKKSNIQQTLNVYIDLKDTKTKNIDYEFIKTLIQFLSAHYEDNLDKMYFRNAKIMFKTIYKVIRPFIPKSTRKKIYFEKQTNNNNNIQIEHISECEYGDI